MSRIEFAPRVQCDMCHETFAEDAHHGRLVLFDGFGDLSRKGNGRCTGARDLCDACKRRVVDYMDMGGVEPLGLDS